MGRARMLDMPREPLGASKGGSRGRDRQQAPGLLARYLTFSPRHAARARRRAFERSIGIASADIGARLRVQNAPP